MSNTVGLFRCFLARAKLKFSDVLVLVGSIRCHHKIFARKKKERLRTVGKPRFGYIETCHNRANPLLGLVGQHFSCEIIVKKSASESVHDHQ
jgi:hypothetical protein